MCALRIIRRVPDLIDHFTVKSKALLQDRNHGVLLTGITLVTEMCALDDKVCEEFRQVCSLSAFGRMGIEAYSIGYWITGETSQIARDDGL